MFELSLLDHLRLTFGHVVSRHRLHTRLAASNARWSHRLRAAETILIAGVAVLAGYAALGKGRPFEIACAVLAGFAFATVIVHQGLDLSGSARAHAACVTRLWLIRERYRALLSDLADGAIEIEAARLKRDELMHDVHRMYEDGPFAGHHAYREVDSGTAAADRGLLTDEDIDLLLPKPFQKAWKSAA